MRILVLGFAMLAFASAASSQSSSPTASAGAVLKDFHAGQTFRDCPECPEMVVIPAGSFTMGSPPNEPGRFSGEDPLRKVTIRQFAAGKFDVTRGQWAVFAKVTNRATHEGCKFSGLPKGQEAEASWRNLGFQQDDSHPVVCVTWSDAQDYAHWLSKRTGHKYRLLTEAEWEYAARAGTTTAFPWGPTASHEYANYGTEKCCGDELSMGRDQWVETSPVGSFPPNGFGLYDMIGNVLQFVQDCFAPSYSGLATDGSAYEVDVELKATDQKLHDSVVGFCTQDVLDGENNAAKLQECVAEMSAELGGTRSCSYRMARGGDWGDPPKEIRSAFRAPWADSDRVSTGLGFRVARDLN
jgi:formylglycine-generating enzyme required for sulfatase activity